MIETVEELARLLEEKEDMINNFRIDDKVITKLNEKGLVIDINHSGLYIDLKGKLSECILVQLEDSKEPRYFSPEDLRIIF